MNDDIPKSWVGAPLDSLCKKFRGVSYGRDDASAVPKKDYVPILRANNLQNDRLIFDELVWVSADHVSDQQKLRIGDIVIAMSSGSKSVVGKTAQVMEDWQGSFGAFCGVLRPWPELNSRYVGLFLRTREYRNTISELAAGSNINNLKNEHLAAIEVPVAPLAEQRRIVTKLEKLLGQVDACQQRLEKMPTLLKRFRQSILAAACSGRLTADWREENPTPSSIAENDLPNGWQQTTVGDAIESLKYGTSQKCSHEKQGVPVLRIPNIADGVVSQADLKYAKLPEKEFQLLRLRVGDILLIRSNGSVSLVGKCALVRAADKDFAYAGYLIRLRPDAKKVSPEFLNLVLGSYDVRKQIEIPARSTSGVNNINSEEVRALEFILPPLAEQQEIVRRVAGQFALAVQLEMRLAQARKQVDKLTPSLLARAFAGKLVSQNPEDEPASVLLKRIQTDK